MTLVCPRLFGTEIRPARFSRVSGWVHVGKGLVVHLLDLFDGSGPPVTMIVWFSLESVS